MMNHCGPRPSDESLAPTRFHRQKASVPTSRYCPCQWHCCCSFRLLFDWLISTLTLKALDSLWGQVTSSDALRRLPPSFQVLARRARPQHQESNQFYQDQYLSDFYLTNQQPWTREKELLPSEESDDEVSSDCATHQSNNISWRRLFARHYILRHRWLHGWVNFALTVTGEPTF